MGTSDADTRPNIILIMADDMGYSDIGCFGSEINTPTLDALGYGGLRLSQMYNGARCCPTRASLLTGVYGHQAGVGSMVGNGGVPAYQGYLRDDCITMAEALRDNGYQTLMSGKWHVGGSYAVHIPEQWHRDAGQPDHPTPRQRGFNRFYGTLTGGGSYFNPPTLMRDNTFVEPEGDDYYLTDAISDEAAAMIDESLTEDPDRPFFLYMAYTAPHWPLHARPEDVEKYRGCYDEGWDTLREERAARLRKLSLIDESWPLSPRDPESRPWEEAEHKDWESLRMAVYAAQVESMDRGIGRVVNTLKARNAFENTLIVFLSDNGGCAEFLREDGEAGTWPEHYSLPTGKGTMCKVGNTPTKDPGPAETFMSYDLPWANASNTPFRLFKSFTHEGGISTPFLMHWPQAIEPDRLAHTPSHIIDMMATFMEVSGTAYPDKYGGNDIQPMEGVSLTPLFGGGEVERANPLFWEHGNCRAVRDGRWKLSWDRREERWELYDIEADRTELNDLSETKPEIRDRLIAAWEAWAERVGVFSRK
ncbi:MAG: arylsulfatase [Planctomycetota bacterium]|jgi:arylsulfatase